MTAPLTSTGRWIRDSRGPERALRISTHAEGGVLVLSTWRDDVCVGTVRLTAAEAAVLVAGLAAGLADLSAPTPALRSVEL
jgi:hypothetical protein